MGTVKERGEQDARDRLSIFIGCQCPASRAAVLDQGPPFLSAVGAPYRTWPVRAFGPHTGQTRRPVPIRFQPHGGPPGIRGGRVQRGGAPTTKAPPQPPWAPRPRGRRAPA